ncbi:MAG: class flavin-dependent oxidoreductase [Marmoricola sp.]|nr:class flavin-dependent oxidoreductase [Marmoricola sp.]
MAYGRALEFGSFINPTSSAPQQAVELARLAEDLGLDLVAFQEHPYLPGLRGEAPPRGRPDTEAAGGVHVDGSHYRLSGAKRGPQAAHRMPIHVGGMKPRMLELTGRAADGWLVSQAAMTSQALTEAGTLIDQVAVVAGRNPREIRCGQPGIGDLTAESTCRPLAACP